jgi:hypothetical protein
VEDFINTTILFLDIIHRSVFIQNPQRFGDDPVSVFRWSLLSWVQLIMGNVRKHNDCINISSSQTFRSNCIKLIFASHKAVLGVDGRIIITFNSHAF